MMILWRRFRRMMHLWWHLLHLDPQGSIDVYEIWGHSDPDLIALKCTCGKEF
jgi:hypothetical protein